MQSFKKLLTNPYTYIFLTTYYGVWLVWNFVKIPFSNPAGIISLLPSLNYNPTNNLLRFALAIFLPPLACFIYYWLSNSGLKFWNNKKLRLATSVVVVLASLIMCVGMGIVQASTNAKNNPVGHEGKYAQLDSFHEGEALGPAVSYQDSSLKPYKNYVFLHGVFQDPGRAVLAFKLFGRSIGAVRAFATILTIIAFVLIYVLMLTLFKGSVVKSGLALSLFGFLLLPSTTLPFLGKYLIGIQLPFRDITTILILIGAILGYRWVQAGKRLYAGLAAGAVGFVACIGFVNSTDRAIYGLMIATFWLILIAFISRAKIFTRVVLPAFALGGILGLPVVGAALKWDFVDFILFLKAISRYKEFLDGIPFNRPDVPVSLLMLLTAGGITIIGAWLLQAWQSTASSKASLKTRFIKLRTPLAKLINEHFVVILLFATSTVFLRSAVGRADLGHFTYSVQWIYLLLIYLFVAWLYARWGKKQSLIYVSILVLVCACAFFVGSVKKIDLSKDAFPIHVKDESFVRADHMQTAKFIKQNLRGDESFMTFTSEGSWYYLVDKPSPVQFPIVWFAFLPQQRQDLANSIEQNDNIKYIITNNNWTSNFDYVPVNERLPEAYKVLETRYEPVRGFGQQTVWQRKQQ